MSETPRSRRFRTDWLRPKRLDASSFDLGWKLDDDDVMQTLVEHRPAPLLFNKGPPERIMLDLERIGVLEHLRRLGYDGFSPQFAGENLFESRFSLVGEHPEVEGACLLVDIRTHTGELKGDCPLTGQPVCLRAIVLDWLNLQDPARPLTVDRVALPGQTHPGLGIFRRAQRLTIGYLRETDYDVAVNVPEYFHNAVLYSRYHRFFLPERQGRFLALKRDLLSYGLGRASHALASHDHEDRVVLQEDGSIVQWTPAEQMLGLSRSMQEYFRDARYTRAVTEEMERNHYRLVKREA